VIFKKDLVSDFVGMGGAPGEGGAGVRSEMPLQDSTEEGMVLFMSSVLDSAQLGWSRTVPGYRDAKLVLFRNAIESACGFAEAATGPFYCPGDQKVYIDLAFFDQLDRQFGAPGDFAQAYVLAHEIGHHVQNVLGTERELRDAQQRDPQNRNRLSVAMELQADCYAGVWAYQAARNGQLQPGDLDEGLSAASAVGDDRLQRMGAGRVNPETFTHGSSADRARWFRRGFDTGQANQCDTFAAVR
jgi:predicted metalloprotease